MSDSSSEDNINAPKVVKPIVDSDSSDDEVVPKPKAKAAVAPAKAVVEDSSSDDDEPAPKPKAAPKAAPVMAANEDSSSDDEEPAPKPKAKAAAKAAVDDSSSEEEVVAAKPAVKVAPKPVVDSDSESESPHKGQVAPKVQAAAADSDDSSDEVAVAPTAKVAVAPKAKVPALPAKDSDSSSEDDEPMTPAAQTKPEKNQTVKAKAKLDAAVEETKQSSTVITKQKGDDDSEDFRVIVKGLPFTAAEKALKKDFSSCGSIKHVKVLQDDKGKARGIAFIVFASSAGVDAALQLDGDKEKYKGRTLSVERAEKRKGPPPGAENKRPEQKDKDRKRKAAEGGSSGSTAAPDAAQADPNAMVTKATFQQMLRLQESKDFSSLEKMFMKLAKSCVAAQERARQQQGGANKKRHENMVFVKGLPHKDFDDEAFQKRFQDCGDVKFVWLPRKADGETKGFGKIGFKTVEGFEKALQYNGTKCKGGELTVVKSEPTVQGTKAAGEAKEGSETKAVEQTPKRKKPSKEEVSSSEVVEKAPKKQKTDQKKQKAEKA